MSVPFRTLWRETQGASALEFALVSPIFIAMLFGVFYVGMAFYCDASVRHAVQKNSRMLILNPATSASALQDAVTADLSSIPVENLSVTVTSETADAYEKVDRISWHYSYTLSIPLFPDFLINSGSSLVVPMLATN
ncbi:pilus assembly protein [Asticcacaulis sp. EMRT-3]|uniref:TadE/TadG family type IV pilus assembly protein n=1 Tax=Asticcacaulis sp. EMRT-3 TaxID=3040349 RepID=UPI0024AF6E75|nr:pilus assembly protein [Asticcacaulis sp. EMRT-3]MDI7776562.1 pilus assembly protein [Asticcacaulis sp. EMRT-3]